MLRERITITVEPGLVTAIDSLVDRQTLRNRSHAIEHLLKEGLGLHQVEQAVLFFDAPWQAEQLKEVAAACTSLGIGTLFIGLPLGEAARVSELGASLRDLGEFIVTHLPTDFGSGGALLLQREALAHPFLVFWVGPGLHAPASVLPAYVFHRQHHALLTRLVRPSDGSYAPAGIDILQPDLLAHIPAGQTDLIRDIYPELTRSANVRAYVLS